MQTINEIVPLRAAISAARKAGHAIALVPTMGSLHLGHLELIREARKRADFVIVSIFVNPKQFGVNEDFGAYPRQLEQDTAALVKEGADLLWAPTESVMYPQGFSTNISVLAPSSGLCGNQRAGHFDGVATVVCKLFHQIQPDTAIFGEKDWQQLAVIRQMARDLDFTHPAADAIIGVPTVRETDGLALSSRNQYLSAKQREIAATLPAAMRKAVAAMKDGAAPARVCETLAAQLIAAGFEGIDYAEVRSSDLQTEIRASSELASSQQNGGARLFVAARIGKTRLIDNMAIE